MGTPKTVFILGAGASKMGGSPLMGEFLDVAQDLWARGDVGDDASKFETVFQMIGSLQIANSKARLDLSNIEALFNIFEMARLLGVFPMPGSTTTAEVAIDALRGLIAATLEATTRFAAVVHGNSIQLHAPEPYERFVELLKHLRGQAAPRHNVALFTFNYDLGLDYALARANVQSDYCLVRGAACTVPLLKLHGSLNWAIANSPSADVVPWSMHDYTSLLTSGIIANGPGVVRVAPRQHFQQFPGRQGSLRAGPFIVPPTWNKTDHHHAIKPVWERAAQELRDAENIFVVGYSLPETDGFFKTLYALGTVGDVPLRRFWVFDPAPRGGGVESRFRDMLGTGAEARFEYFPVPFDQAINILESRFPKG